MPADRHRSEIFSSLQSVFPVNAMTFAPFLLADSAADIIFSDVPLVESTHSMSFGFTNASTCLKKTCSKS